jgi:transcriptional regulator with XRE-family HTH domain
MQGDEFLQVHRQATKDFRLALGLELATRRTAAGYTLAGLSRRVGIPLETLRSYEKGTAQPQIMRLADIGQAYSATAFALLVSAAEYIYRASGEPIPDRDSSHPDRIALRALALYCGVTPAQLRLIESVPPPIPYGTDGWA